jgi:hypothetical protein
VILEPGKDIYFSTYLPPTLIHLSSRFTRASKLAAQKSFDCCLSHFRFNLFVISETFVNKVEPHYATNTSQIKQETFIYEYPLHWVPLPIKNKHNRMLLLRSTHLKAFWLLKPASEHAHARLLTVMSWSWTVLLPGDTHRKPITSITAVLLSFATYLLTLPRIL